MLQPFLALSYIQKKAMTATPSAFAIYVNWGGKSFVHECVFKML